MEPQKEIGRISGRAIAIQTVANSDIIPQTSDIATSKPRTGKRPISSRHGKCPLCGQPFDYEQLELHHILPIARFPELGQSIRNGIMLCHKCHKEVHCNPWKNIELMKAKAEELGIDLKERYQL